MNKLEKKLCILLSFLLLSTSCGREQIVDSESFSIPGFNDLFDDSILPRLTLSLSEDEWNRLLAAYDRDNHNHDYVKCSSVTLDRGDALLTSDGAGLRLRGQTSRRRPESEKGKWRRVHFGLHFQKFTEKGDIAGVRRINLKYAKEDPSYIREHFCFDLLSRYGVWTAPRSSWCRLSLAIGKDSPIYYGVYLMVESIDRQYILHRPAFGNAKGFLWKCAWGANLRDTDEWRFHLDDNSSDTYAYELKEEDPELFASAKAQLKDFITKLNSLSGSVFYNWIQKVCDVDLLLKMYAANVALGHWDDYWNDMNNFYLYFNSRDSENYRVYMLPYDYDNTLGTSLVCGVQTDSGRQDPFHWGIEECVLLTKLLSVADFRLKYKEYLKDFSTIDNPWTGQLQSASRIRVWQSLLGPFLRNDTDEDMSLRDAPASWGNHPEYRLLEDGPNNWFRVKAQSIASFL